MGWVSIDDTILTGIADAIRQHDGGTTQYKPSEMPAAIKVLELSDEQEILESIINRTITEYSNDTITTVGGGVFKYCSTLTSIDLPACGTIGYNAFYRCSNLTTINLPVCETIGLNAFHSCDSLVTVDLPACITIPGYGFGYCDALTTVNLPACASLDNDAFYYCSNLTTINLPVCNYIGQNAFRNCYNLTTLILRNETMATLYYDYEGVFYKTPIAGYTDYTDGELGYIYVPSALIDTYKANSKWSTYAEQFRAIEDYPEVCG